MNLEIASRLVALRKENNLSQEALAEKLGISRQAVSKWERAEASPDTDNLIALAKLYHVSLDELLKIHEDEENDEPGDLEQKETRIGFQAPTEFGSDTENQEAQKEYGTGDREYEQAIDAEEDVHVGFDGIHVKDKDGEVHVSWRGIHVHDKKNDNEVHIDGSGIRVNGEEAENHFFTRGNEAELPLGIIAIVVYILMGIFWDLWHPGWLIFFLVPIISTLIHAVRRHNPDLFAYPVLVVLVFLYAGLIHSIWHPAWAVFLTIPVYYSITGYIRRTRTQDVEEQDSDQVS